MLIGTKFGKDGELGFKLPDLTEASPQSLDYCIATKGEVPEIHSESEADMG